jgi:hypothetical protein
MRLGKPLRRTRFRRFDLVLLLAAAGVVLPAPLSVRDAAWVPNLEMLPLALGGLLVGYGLERTRLPGSAGHLLATVIGLETVTYTYARLPVVGSMTDRVAWLAGRVGAWLEAISGGGVSNDPVVFAVTMAALAWLLGQTTAWLVFRDGAPWLALAINGLALLMNLSYAPTSLAFYLPWFLFGCALLLAAQQVAYRQELWRRAQRAVDMRVGLRLLLGTALAVGAVLSLAFALPSNLTNREVSGGWNRATAPWQALEREFDRWFAALKAGDRTARGLNFGRTLAPRGAFDLGDTPVLLVRSTQPLYLRATTADRYAGQAITGTETSAASFGANTDLVSPDEIPAGRTILQASVRILASRSAVAFAPEAPLQFGVDTEVDMRGSMADIAAVRLPVPLAQNQEYSFVSGVSTATVQELRAASTGYPDWVEQRYLQLPRRMPGRVVRIAESIVAGADTPYDKATAVERYLRASYTYSTHVPEVPPDRDWVDFFLFDSQQGYCDYFATAMAVLLRMQGVPARVASGFAPGDLDDGAGGRVVREYHAHSWVEVYFPGHGWQTFEPSAIRSVPERAERAPSQPSTQAVPATAPNQPRLTQEEIDELENLRNAGSSQSDPDPFLRTWPGIALVVLAVTLGMAVVAAAGLTVAWRQGLGRLAIYQRPYAQLLRLGRWFQLVRPSAAQTPFEVADSMARELPAAEPTIRELAAAYVEGTYARRQPAVNPWPVWLAARGDLVRQLVRRWVRRALHH